VTPPSAAPSGEKITILPKARVGYGSNAEESDAHPQYFYNMRVVLIVRLLLHVALITRSILLFFKRGFVSSRCTLGSAVFREFFSVKRLELKSLKGRTKAEELGTRGPQFLSLRPPLMHFSSRRF
jgi:hypothetical protein